MSSPKTAPLSNSPRARRDHAFEQWLATVRRVCGSFGAQPLSEHFSGRLQDLSCGSLRMSLAESDRLSLFKQQRHLDMERDRIFYTVLQLRGSSCVEQLDQRASLEPGDFALLDGGRPFSVDVSDQSRQISLILPSAMLDSGRQRVACARRVEAGSVLGKWARELILDAVANRERELKPVESEAMLTALVSLIKPAVCLGVDDDSLGHERLYVRACGYIDEHLSDEDLSPEQIARATGVSVRGLYRLFARHRQVVSQYIRNCRLDRCAAILRAGGMAAANLGALSYAWGFADASHFSLAFKKRFGESPSDYRRRHCH